MAFFYRFLTGATKALSGSLYEDFNAEINDESNENNLITRDGGYLTLIDFKGALSVMDGPAMDEFLEELLNRLDGDLKQSGRVLEFCIMHYPEMSKKVVGKSVDLIMDTSKKLKLDAGAFFDEKREILNDVANYYSCYLSIYTSPDILGSMKGDVIARDMRQKAEKKLIYRMGEHTPGPGVGISEVGDTHNAFIKNLRKAIDGKINYEVYKAKDALLTLKQIMFLETTSDRWSARFPGDKLKVNNKKSTPVTTDLSDLLSAPLATQFYDISPTRDSENSSLVDIDGKKFAPLTVEYGPSKPSMFSILADNLKGEIPYRVNLAIFTGHEDVKKSLAKKSALGSYIQLFNSNNSSIKKSVDELLNIGEHHSLCEMAITACTWGDNREECVRNKRILMQAMNNWSGVSAIEERGDPIGMFAESVGGLNSTKRRQAPRFPVPVFEALNMCPLSQPSSAWEVGSFMFLTPYDSVYPIEMGSPKQTSWLNLVSAPPGYGKSFLLSAMNLSNIVKSGASSLPVLSILDIGYSSAVFVRLIQAMLPADKKYLAQAYKLQNTKEYSINIFDTMLGCRYPTSLEKSQIEDLVMELLTPGDGSAFEGMSEIVKLMVDKVYTLKSDKGEPNEYGPGQSRMISEALEKHGVHEYEGMTWWKVTDALAKAGEDRLAKVAQRYAVPKLSDLSSVLNDEAFADYKKYSINGMGAIDKIKGAIKHAVRDYPILSTISQFDIGDARIISLDLQDVVPRTDGDNSKQANVMYMLGKLATTKSFYMGKEALSEVNPDYKDYHAKVFDELDSVQKFLCVDEYHRTKSSNVFRSGLIRDAREGRKFGVIISVISQYDTDFDDDLVKASTNKFLLYVGEDASERERIADRFSISRAAMDMAKVRCHGPGPEGSNVLYVGKIKGKGTVQQILRYVGGVKERWAYTTNKKDDRLIGKLIEKVGVTKAYDILAKEFPDGTAEPYLDALSKSDEVKSLDVDLITYVSNKLVRDNYRSQ